MGKLTSVTDAQRRVIASRHLCGHTAADLDGFAGLTADQIRKLLRTERMKNLLEEAQAQYRRNEMLSLNRARHELPYAMERMCARGKSENQELAFKADKFVIDKLLPTPERHVVDQRSEVHHHVTAEVGVMLKDALNDIKTVFAGSKGNGHDFTQHVLLGTEGIETVEPPDTTTDLVVVETEGSGPNHPERDPDGKPEPPPAQ
jgi:hypothetical protein